MLVDLFWSCEVGFGTRGAAAQLRFRHTHHLQKTQSPFFPAPHAPAPAEDIGEGASEVGARKGVEAQDVGQRRQDAVLWEGREVLDQRDGLADGVGVCGCALVCVLEGEMK
jgi:hypothetical protein